MSTLPPLSEIHTLLSCGWCGKKGLSKTLTESGCSYTKNCICCQCLTFNHKSCARLYVKQLSDKKAPDYMNAVSIEGFSASRLPYFCQECHQKECFVCNKKHSQRKYMNCIIILYSVCNNIF